MQISLLDIRIRIMFLLTALALLLRLLSAIRILGNGHFVPILLFWAFFRSLLGLILNDFENNLC
jgi:hypothetical protein